MNVSIIVGILLFALGTGAMVYGFSIIVGILLNAFGTGMIVYGQYVKNKSDSAEVSRVLQDKVGDVLKRIDAVREGEKDKASAGEIQQIEQEFQTWAAEFLKDREQRKLELARTHLDSVDIQLKISNKLRPIFEYVLKTIDSMAKAYNAESGETIKVDFPPIHPNLYSDVADNYGGKVIFPNKVIWSIEFSSTKPPRKNYPPSLFIFYQTEENLRHNSFFAITHFDKKSFQTQLNGPDFPTAEGIEGIYPFESYRESLKTILQRLFEAQLLRD